MLTNKGEVLKKKKKHNLKKLRIHSINETIGIGLKKEPNQNPSVKNNRYFRNQQNIHYTHAHDIHVYVNVYIHTYTCL